MKLYLATSNAGKVREFLGAGLNVELLPGLEHMEVAPETGHTFEANAIQKALYYSVLGYEPLISEDSGLEVEALSGAPGIHSARWAGNDTANNYRLLREMEGVANRSARYVCVIALVRAQSLLATFRGEVKGEILPFPRGEGGFGYDPYFYYPPLNQSFAEISKERKASVSHRGAAIAQLCEWLRKSVSR